MISLRHCFLAAMATAVLSISSQALAQLTEYTWNSTLIGDQQWQVSGNWDISGFPNDPMHSAILAGELGGHLSVNIGSGVTIAGLSFGGESVAITTDITSSGGQLTFQNDYVPEEPTGNADFDGNNYVDGADFLIWQRGLGLTGQEDNSNGDANADSVVDNLDLVTWQEQFGSGTEIFSAGSAFIMSSGVAGTINRISAPMHSNNESVEFGGTIDVVVDGNFSFSAPVEGSSAQLRVNSLGMTVTLNDGLTMIDPDAEQEVDEIDFRINDWSRSYGKMVINGIVSGEGDLYIGLWGNRASIGTVELHGDNTFLGSIRAGRGNLILGHDHALGFDPAPEDPGHTNYRQDGPANQFGYNLISTSDDRVIPNNMTIAQWQTIRGEHSLEWAGNITQTNNRGLINLLPAGKKLVLSGRIDIWEDDEPDVERRFVIDGTGETWITGSINNDPLGSSQERILRKSGSGVLFIDVDSFNNFHLGPTIVDMGNLHYVDEDSLNVGGGKILARGGAVGIDTGVMNSTFIGLIDPESTGGLMLAASDASTNLDFTGNLANAANMSVAAPETSINYTGTITPANNRYLLGGGAGTLTLPNAQLTGSNSLEVRNGGMVQLLGNNTFTGSTTIITRYTTSHQYQAEADTSQNISSLLYEEVAPTLVVDHLANGGAASSIGAASSDAANLLIQGSTLKYVGSGDSTDRLFTVGTGGATIDSSGTGAVVFSNSGNLGMDDADDKIGALDDWSGINSPTVIYEVQGDLRDVIIGMPVTDPDLPIEWTFPVTPTPPHIPADTVVTGVNIDEKQIGISSSYGYIMITQTRIVFGAVPRTLTLTGNNTGTNTLTPVISDSAAGSVVSITKSGPGTWYLNGANTNTGDTVVEEGTLGGNGGAGGNLIVQGGATFAPGSASSAANSGAAAAGIGGEDLIAPGSSIGDFNVAGDFTLNEGATLAIELAGTDPSAIDLVNVVGDATLSGILDIALVSFSPSINDSFTVLSAGSILDDGLQLAGAAGFTHSIVGSDLVLTFSGGSALAAIPEPGSCLLLGLACIGWLATHRRGHCRGSLRDPNGR